MKNQKLFYAILFIEILIFNSNISALSPHAAIYQPYSDDSDYVRILNGYETAVIFQQPGFSFQLKTGNKFIYFITWSTYYGGGSRMQTARIISDTIAYGKKYYKAVNFPHIGNDWIRFDTITGSLYRFDSTNSCPYYYYESIIDSLSARLNDSTKWCLSAYSRAKCTDTTYLNIFGESRQKKKFDVNCSVPPYTSCNTSRTYIDSLGIFRFNWSSTGSHGYSSEFWELRGAVLSGKAYGDTSLTQLSVLSSDIPSDYRLYQNYPNPFNPSTNIGFRIAGFGLVTLKILDINGREVITLINEELKAGEYKIDWNASAYSSGIYFYRLTVTNGKEVFEETKKMILLK